MSETLSRRSLLGWLAAAAVAVTVPVLTSEEAEAQTPGMERRQSRRAGRRLGRQMRRAGRRASRAARRAGRRGAF